LILLEQEPMQWQWHQLDHMQIICTSLQTDNQASTSPLSFLQARCPSCHPTNSVKALKAVRIASLLMVNFSLVDGFQIYNKASDVFELTVFRYIEGFP